MTKLTAQAEQTHFCAPKHMLPLPTTATIAIEQVAPPPKNRPKAEVDECLLIGFDTEYQSLGEVAGHDVRSGTIIGKNEVLSYQLCAKKVAKTALLEKETNGIIVPERGQRLELADFIAFAIGSWCRDNPGKMIPHEVYLVGHFTRADLPGFATFASNIKHWASSIRNTMASVGNYMTLEVTDGDKATTFKVRIRDTMLLSPSNAKSLSALGEIVNLEKIQLAPTPQEEADIKENMSKLLDENWELFKDYAIRDAVICVRYAERVVRKCFELTGRFHLPVTMTSLGVDQVISKWQQQDIDVNAVLGKERAKNTRYSKGRRRLVTVKEDIFIDKVFWEMDFVTSCYHGGRNEQFVFGPAKQGAWRDLDLSSAYPTAMSLLNLPRWETLRHITDLSEIGHTDLAYCSVDFEFPHTIRYPTLPVRTEGGIIFPRTGRSECAAPEIFLALRLGATLKLRWGCVVSTDPDVPIFSDFIRDCIAKRKDFPKGSFDNLLWKEISNATYGKTAQGTRKKRVFDLREDDMVELPPSRITQPFFAAFITSYVRAVLGEIMNALPESVDIFSVTTDGFLSTASQAEIDAAVQGPLARTFHAAKQHLDPGSVMIEEKHRVIRPVGWRTRGSATLEPDLSSDPSSGIVLQKGGIKTREYNDVAAENEFIVRLFFDRTPTDTFEYSVPLSIRDMVRHDADFIFTKVVKTLRMEYDWKRRPHLPEDVQVTFTGMDCVHLAFDTRPLEDIAEFERFRSAMTTLNKRRKTCLKTSKDLDMFIAFAQTKKLPKSVGTYISTVDGDLRRLRRDLCRAFYADAAGFAEAKIRFEENGECKLTARKLAEILTVCGIECSKPQTDYGKRAVFEPNQVLDTMAARDAFKRVKKHLFELDEELFFCEIVAGMA